MLGRLPSNAASASATCCAFLNNILAGDGGGVGLVSLNVACARLAPGCALRVAAGRRWRGEACFVGRTFGSAGRRLRRRGLSISASAAVLREAAGRLTLRTGVLRSERGVRALRSAGEARPSTLGPVSLPNCTSLKHSLPSVRSCAGGVGANRFELHSWFEIHAASSE